MKAISILVLLCSAASTLEGLTCRVESAAAKIAVDHINEHHHHGYKFQLTDFELYETDLSEELCIMKMRLNLTETTCHVINPKPYEDCESRDTSPTPVVATCNVEIHVKENESSVNKSDCDTRRVFVEGCMDCPVLINVTDPVGLSSVSEAVTDFNKNTSNDHYYILQEIGWMKLAYMFSSGTGYFAEFVLVETHCPRESKIVPEACRPLCPDRAHHALCKSSFTTMKGLMSVECEFYPPENTTVLENEPLCPHSRPHPGGAPLPGPPGGRPGDGPPGGRPGDGPPGGPPPPRGPVGPPAHPFPCVGLREFDHALHPICPWPVPEISPVPRPSDS